MEVLEGAEKALDGVSRRLKTEFNSVMDNLEESAGFVDEEVESVFEPVEGLYVAPITLEEYKATKLKGREYKSSWDELFFDLALVATFGSLAQILALFEPLHRSAKTHPGTAGVGNAFNNLKAHAVTAGKGRVSYVVRLVRRDVRLSRDKVRAAAIGEASTRAIGEFERFLPLFGDKDALAVGDFPWNRVSRE